MLAAALPSHNAIITALSRHGTAFGNGKAAVHVTVNELKRAKSPFKKRVKRD